LLIRGDPAGAAKPGKDTPETVSQFHSFTVGEASAHLLRPSTRPKRTFRGSVALQIETQPTLRTARHAWTEK